MNKSDGHKLVKASDEIEKKIRRALLGGQTVQIASDHSNLVGGDITVGDNAYGIVGNNNVISIRGVDEEHLTEILQTVEKRIAKDKYSRALQTYLKALTNYCDNFTYLTLHSIPSAYLSKTYVPVRFLAEKQADQKDLVSIEEILNSDNQNHIMLFGEPGAGKSTILRQIAKYAWSEPSKIGLKESYLPILLPLRVFSKLHFSLQERIRQTLESMDMLDLPLPEDFFSVWEENEQVKWMFLLDGLDEVPADERTPLFKLIKDLMSKDNCRVIITSRPSGYQAGELNEERITKYVLQPFSLDQVKEFAENWFADKDSHFLRSLEDLRVKTLYESPLLLTIAAKVYLERIKKSGTGSLPGQRAKLYEEFVDICLEEARLRGLRDDLGENLARDSKYGLAHLAWEMTRRPHRDSEDELAQEMTHYLQWSQNLGEDRARTLGRDFLHAMSRRSGIFVKEGRNFNWLHPTFREYLAAWHMVEKEMPQLDIDDYDQREVFYRFVYPQWTESTLFAIEILAGREKDITPWVKGFYKARGPLYAGDALSTLGETAPELATKIIGELLSLARSDWRGGKSVALLGNLCTFYLPAKEALVHLVYENGLTDELVREEAIILLEKAGHADVLLNLACDTQLHPYQRKDAALALTRLPDQTDTAARACMEIAQDDRLGMQDEYGIEMQSVHYIKMDIVKALANLSGWGKEAASLSLQIIRDESYNDYKHRQAVEILWSTGQFDKLIEVTQDMNIDLDLRMRAVVHILESKLQNMGYGQPTFEDRHERKKWLIKVANNEGEDLCKRFWAALEIINSGNYPKIGYISRDGTFQVIEQGIVVARTLASSPTAEHFLREFASEIAESWSTFIPQSLKIIYHNENDQDVRIRIIRRFALAGRNDILLDLIHNKAIETIIRLAAATFFVENKFTKEDASLKSKLELARDNQVNIYIRFSAAIEPFTTFDESAHSEVRDILLALLAEVETDIPLLTVIVNNMEYLGDTRCLSELEKLLQHPNEEVRQSAEKTIQEIRQREKL